MSRGATTRGVAVLAAATLSLLLVACSDESSTTPAGGDTSAMAGGTVDVTLQEFAVSAVPSTIGAGEVTFDVTNDGPEDVHEFVIIRTDLPPTDLPVDEDGAVSEDGEGLEVVNEIEDIPVGSSQSVTATLDAGAYALICNIVQTEDDGTIEAHYSKGMRTAFTVT